MPTSGEYLHQQADEPQRFQASLLADEQAEMRAGGPGRAVGQQPVPGGVVDPVLGIVEHPGVESGLGQDGRWVETQLSQDRRQRQGPADPQRGLGAPAPCLGTGSGAVFFAASIAFQGVRSSFAKVRALSGNVKPGRVFARRMPKARQKDADRWPRTDAAGFFAAAAMQAVQ